MNNCWYIFTEIPHRINNFLIIYYWVIMSCWYLIILIPNRISKLFSICIWILMNCLDLISKLLNIITTLLSLWNWLMNNLETYIVNIMCHHWIWVPQINILCKVNQLNITQVKIPFSSSPLYIFFFCIVDITNIFKTKIWRLNKRSYLIV